MAADDIFQSRFHFENPSGAGSFHLYFKETAPVTSEDPCRMIADALHNISVSWLRASLSDDWYYAGLEVAKMHDDPRPMYLREAKDGAGFTKGLIPGPGLPANNCVQFDVIQDTFGAKSHGRFNMPGIPESKAAGGRLDSVYVGTELSFFAATLLPELVEPAGGAGRWIPGVISAKVRDVALPAKDWLGAFAPAVSIQPISIISRQTRRTSRVRGFATLS